MQAVILAAGDSSRIYPFNESHKSAIKILGKSILEHTLLSVKKSGIDEVIIIVQNDGVRKIIEEIDDLRLKIQYVVQDKATGAGDALLLAEPYIKDDFFLLHAHRVDFLEFKKDLEKKKVEKEEVVLLAKKVKNLTDLEKLGVLKTDGDKVVEVAEKPLPGKAPSNLAIVGVYLLNRFFLNVLREIPSEHYSFEKAISRIGSGILLTLRSVHNASK